VPAEVPNVVLARGHPRCAHPFGDTLVGEAHRLRPVGPGEPACLLTQRAKDVEPFHGFLRAFPQHLPAQRGQLVVALGDRGEVVARELACLARESRRSVRKQDLGLAEAARVQEKLAGRRVAGVVLVADVQGEVAEGDPA